MANDHLAGLEELDELQRLIGETLDPKQSQQKDQADQYAKLAIKLARKKEWALVRDFFLYEIALTEPDYMMKNLAAANISPEEVGQRMLIAYEVNVHLNRILSNVEGLVEKGKLLQQAVK